MKPRDVVFAALGLAAATVFTLLGVWQLERLAERRAFNEGLRARAATRPVELAELPRDTGSAHYRRVRISGTYDFGNEFVITNRSRNGSPGVNIVTPVRIAESDTAVLVNRGWVYAPDGMTVGLERWREPAEVSGDAYVENYQTRDGSVRTTSVAKALRWMDRRTLIREFPYPLAPWYLVLIGNSVDPPSNVPPRVPVPALDEGSHRSYAIQWFSFAAISIIGMILYLRRK